jgi:hypothetical protein
MSDDTWSLFDLDPEPAPQPACGVAGCTNLRTHRHEPVALVQVAVPVCTCLRTRGQGEGFTNLATPPAEMWAHVACRRPTGDYLDAAHPHLAHA